MTAVVIGIDPHKQTHQAVALDDREGELARLEVRATKTQVDRLMRWAAPFKERTWAIESAGGLGYLLAQQLVDAGERVIDVPPTLASRVRLLGSGKSNKNDPNDARSVAIAAMRSAGLAALPGSIATEVAVFELLRGTNDRDQQARDFQIRSCNASLRGNRCGCAATRHTCGMTVETWWPKLRPDTKSG